MTKPGPKQLPKNLKKKRVTIRLRPWMQDYINQHNINLSQYLEEKLKEDFADINKNAPEEYKEYKNRLENQL